MRMYVTLKKKSNEFNPDIPERGKKDRETKKVICFHYYININCFYLGLVFIQFNC